MKGITITFLSLLLAACGPSQEEQKKGTATSPSVDVAQVQAIITERCTTCHSSVPSDDVFKVAPSNVMFDNLKQMQLSAARIHARSVATQTMPFMNKTQMTDEERKLIGAWVKAGAPIK